MCDHDNSDIAHCDCFSIAALLPNFQALDLLRRRSESISSASSSTASTFKTRRSRSTLASRSLATLSVSKPMAKAWKKEWPMSSTNSMLTARMLVSRNIYSFIHSY